MMADPKKTNSTDLPYSVLPDGELIKNKAEKIANVGKIPTVFIGSSRESIGIAKQVQGYLKKHQFDVDIWSDGIFGRTRSTGGDMSNAEWLKNFTDIYDFAIFLFVPDDQLFSKSRKNEENDSFLNAMATRHNVIFEFGWFLGRIGAKRSYILIDEATKPFIKNFFTDLVENMSDAVIDAASGEFKLELHWYKSNYQETYQPQIEQPKTDFSADNWQQKMEEIRKRMEAVEKEIEIGFLPSTSLALGYFNNFLRPVIDSIDAIGQTSLPEWVTEKIKDSAAMQQFVDTLRKNKRSVIFKIVLSDLEDTRIDNTDQYYKSAFFSDRQMPTVGRPKTIHCKASSLANFEEDIVIYDIPTTASTSLASINLVTRPENTDIIDLLSAKEQYNFMKVLKKVVNEHNQQQINDTFKDTIEFIDFDVFLAETGQV